MKTVAQRKEEKSNKEFNSNIEQMTGVKVENAKRNTVLPYIHIIGGTIVCIGLSLFLPTTIYTALIAVWVICGLILNIE